MRPTAKEREEAWRNWGLTDDLDHFEAAAAFKRAVLADGWKATDGTNEHFEKEKFVVHVLNRVNEPPGNRYAYTASVHIWGPDGLAIEPPDAYDWTVILAHSRKCNYCEKTDIDTFRIGFAGRACKDCIPKLRPTHERPGWDA
jgi:hypothetical protein